MILSNVRLRSKCGEMKILHDQYLNIMDRNIQICRVDADLRANRRAVDAANELVASNALTAALLEIDIEGWKNVSRP